MEQFVPTETSRDPGAPWTNAAIVSTMGIETRPVNMPPFHWNRADRQSSCFVSSLVTSSSLGIIWSESTSSVAFLLTGPFQTSFAKRSVIFKWMPFWVSSHCEKLCVPSRRGCDQQQDSSPRESCEKIWMRRIVWKKFVLAYVHNGLHTFLLLCSRKLANGSGGKCDTQLQMQRFVSLAEVRLKREVKKVIGVKNLNTKKYIYKKYKEIEILMQKFGTDSFFHHVPLLSKTQGLWHCHLHWLLL